MGVVLKTSHRSLSRHDGAHKQTRSSRFRRWLPPSFALAAIVALGVASASSTLAVSPTPVTIHFTANDKTYDGTTDASVAASPACTLDGVTDGDDVTCVDTDATATFSTRNAGTDTSVVGANFALGGTDAAKYQIESATGTGTIDTAPLDIYATTDSKTYDGTTSSTATPTAPGLVGGDEIVATQSFASRDVLGPNGSTLVVDDGYTVNDGNGGANYDVAVWPITGTIDTAPLDIYATTDSKTYDSTTSSTATPAFDDGQVQSGDTVANLAQAFDSRNAGARTLSVTAYTVNDGNSGNNYEVTLHTASGEISALKLDINAASDSKTYDGTTGSDGTPTAPGLVGGDELTASQSFASRDVLGANASTLVVNSGYLIDDGNSGNNYDVALHTASGTISQARLDIDAVTDSKTYNRNVDSSRTPTFDAGQVQTGDSVTGLVQVFDSRNAGARILSVSAYSVNDDHGGANYDVHFGTASGTIMPARLDLSAVSDSRTYNGTTVSAGAPTVGSGQVRTGDTVTGLVQVFDSRKAGGRILSVSAYSVNDANSGLNYTVTPHTATGTINRAPLDIYATSDTRGYNGTAASTVAPTVTGTVYSPDSVTGVTQVFDSRNAGARTLSVSAYSVNDANSGLNYTVTPHTASGTINQAPFTLNAANNIKTADGTRSAAATPTYSAAQIQTGDTPGAFTETYDTALAGSNKTLTPAGLIVDGHGGLNYDYTYNTVATGRIRPAAVASLTFTATPIHTKIGTPILASCNPGGSALGPCASTSASVTVTARDAFQNLAGPGAQGADPAGSNPQNNPAINVVIKKDNSGGVVIGPSGGTATNAGLATFGTSLILCDVKLSPCTSSFTGHMQLYAYVATSTGVNNTSGTPDFRIVNDLTPCGSSTCVTKANDPSGSPVNAWNQITGALTNAGTLQTTSFLGGSGAPDGGGACNTGRKYIGDGFDQRVFSAPSAGIKGYQVIVIPKNTLKASGVLSRGTPSFDLCFGAIWVGDPHATITAWTGKSGAAQPHTDSDGTSRYYALPVNCTPSITDPCIALRTKQRSDIVALIPSISSQINSIMSDGDLAIVVRVGGVPSSTQASFWDGGGHAV